jgi:hypothetical protein
VSDAVDKTNGKKWLAFLSMALLIGAILRLSFPGDIEYKTDEKYMFEAAQRIALTGSWPPLGMVSGVEVKNPGMSVWVFGVLSILSRASTPPQLARAVQILNILSLLVLAFFSLRLLPGPERKPWCWATAFAAVNPFAVLFQRKIWAQSTLPFFCILFWITWHYRHKRAGAFFWGLLGIAMGQIHMSGFFLTAGVFLWTILHDRRARWGYWCLGSLVGAIPLVPWLQYMAAEPGNGLKSMSLKWLAQTNYWVFWVTDSLGTGLVYSLKTRQFLDFLRYPLVGGWGTGLVGLLHVVIIVTVICMLISIIKTRGSSHDNPDSSETGLAIHSILIVPGILMTLTCVEICRHYLIMTFPLEWVWLSRLGLRDRRWGQHYLTVIWIAQLLISISFLFYIHINHGALTGDYGTAYQFQTK